MNWEDFRAGLNKGASERNARQLYNYALKYHEFLDTGFSPLQGFSNCKCRLTLEALANLSKYLGCYSRFKQLKADSGVKWGAKNSLEIFKKLYDRNGDDGVSEWFKQVKELSQQYAFPIMFQSLTGLRPS